MPEGHLSAAFGGLDAKALLAAIVESSDDAIVSKSLDGIVTSWNSAAERLFGYRSTEMVGRPITTIIPADRWDEEVTIIAKLSRGERIEHFETQRLTKDGRLIDIAITVSPVRDDAGQIVGASKIVRDISERRMMEARQRFMADELDHRVKNTLAAVLSLATETLSKCGSLEEFSASFTGRVHAMARTHSALARSKWQGVKLEEIADLVLEPYRDEGGNRVRASGPSVSLPPRAATPVSLALHELATNAAKHGALSCPGGFVELTWRPEPEGTSVRWIERGRPSVCATPGHGSGIAIIEGLIRYELRSTVDWRLNPDGVECTIVVPLS